MKGTRGLARVLGIAALYGSLVSVFRHSCR